MTILSTVQNGIAQAIFAAGDAIVAVLVAGSIDSTPLPGEDYDPSWVVSSGVGFWEQANEDDFPGTEIQVQDKSLILMQCSYEVDLHDFVNVDDTVYHVHGVKFDVVGSTRVLQKLLVRAELRGGIPWVSADPQAV